MERPSMLNLDVLTVVLSHMAWRRDISAVMRTCKAVYAAGIPALLKQSIYLGKQQALGSFCDFILKDVSARAKHIKGLEFTNILNKLKDSSIAEKLAEVVKHATGVESLILNSCDKFLAQYSSVTEALSGLKSVKHLSIREGNTDIVNLVKQIQSPIEMAYVHLDGQIDEEDGNPVALLANFQPTLKKLVCWLPYFTDESDGVVYPELRDLDVVYWNNVEMGPMIQAYPNVRTVSLGLQGYDDGGLEEDEEEIREKNATAQENTQWEHLEFVKSDPITLYISALKAELGTLDLSVDWEAPAEQITGILADARPKRLNFRFRTDWDNEDDVSERLPALLNAAAEDITHLYVVVNQIEDPESAIALVCESIAELPKLVHLSFKIKRLSSDEDGQEVAQRFLESRATLTTLTIALDNKKTVYWKVGANKPSDGEDGEVEEGDESESLKEITKLEAASLGVLSEVDAYN